MIINSISIIAQEVNEFPTPCHPCKFAQRSWNQIPAESKILTFGECSYRVWYKKRLCTTDGCQELKLEKVAPFPAPSQQCAAISPDEIVTLVLGKMVEDNAMGFQPDTIGLGSNACWRIIRPSCWSLNADLSNCNWWPGGIPDTTGTIVNYHDSDFVPCDTTQCCTNLLYITRDACGELIIDAPTPDEYAWAVRLRGEPEDSADLDDYYNALDAFKKQFDSLTCIPCNPENPTKAPEIQHYAPPDCKNQCTRDLMMEYRRLLNAKLEEL